MLSRCAIEQGARLGVPSPWGEQARLFALLVALALVSAPLGCAGRSNADATNAGHDGSGGAGGSGGGDTGSGGAGASSAGAASCKAPLAFGDPKVEAAVRTATGVASGPLTPENASQVGILTVVGASSLAGVECLPNLMGISATGGSITDVLPLNDHPKLLSMDLSNNPIATLAGLVPPPRHCGSLLNVQGCPLADSEVMTFCAANWYVKWTGADGSVKSCNPCLGN